MDLHKGILNYSSTNHNMSELQAYLNNTTTFGFVLNTFKLNLINNSRGPTITHSLYHWETN